MSSACVIFRNKLDSYGEESLDLRPAPKLEDHLLPAVHDCLVNTFAAALYICIWSHKWREIQTSV